MAPMASVSRRHIEPPRRWTLLDLPCRRSLFWSCIVDTVDCAVESVAQLRVCGQINWIFFVLSPILWCPWQQFLGIIIMILIKISKFTCEGQVGWYLSAAKAAGYIYGAIRVLLRSRLSTDNNAHNPIILSCKNTGRWKYHSVMGQLDRSRVQSDFFD